MTRLALVIATWFGCGYLPKAPGTAGSLAALAMAWLLNRYTGLQWGSFAFLAMLLLPFAVWAAHIAAQFTGLKDPQIVVVDEVVGQWIAGIVGDDAMAGVYSALVLFAAGWFNLY